MYSASPSKNASTRTKLCRTCLLDNKSNTSVFSIDSTLNIPFCDIVTSVTGLEISRNDGFTEYICSVCKENSKVAYQYKIQALETDEKLRSTIQNINEVTEIRTAFSRLNNLLTDEKENEITVKKDLSDDGNYDCDDIFDEKQASPLCEPVMSVENEFKLEVEEIEEPLALHRCELCEKKFATKSSPCSHLETCIKVEIEDEKQRNCCPVCKEMFDTIAEMTQHVQTHELLMTDNDYSKESAQSVDMKMSASKNPHVKKKKLPGKKTSSPTPRKVKKYNSKKQILQCCFCNKGFKNESSLAKHKMDNTCIAEYKCDICHARMKSKAYLSKHMEIHSTDNAKPPRKRYPCKECGYVSGNEKYLTVHMLRKHRGEKPYKCKYCVRAFKRGSTLRVHTRVHTGEKPYPCNVCGRRFARSSRLGEHMRTHAGVKPYKCSYCPQAYSLKEDAAKHENCHTSTGAYSCAACGLKFAQAKGLHNHEKSCATLLSSRKKAICCICNKRFRSDLSLFNHKMRAHMEKRYECDFCPSTFKIKNSMSAHLLTHQSRQFLCTVCGHAFSTISYLTIHIRRKHTGEKPYNCKYCVKAFARWSDLKMHTRLHTGEKPYSCKVCGKKFPRSCAMKRHMRTHTTEKPYKCSYCDRAFTQSQVATKHERRHMRAAPYACSACGADFQKAKDLRHHKTTCETTS